MTPEAFERDQMLLVHAYVDGELDTADTLAMMQRMAAEPALAAECERIAALQRLMRRHLAGEKLPPGLRGRIDAMIGTPRRRPQPSWLALAASVAVAAVLASGSTVLTVGPGPADMAADSVVSGHIRALMAPQPIDVASSDHHTVKPWFNGRIPEAPRVVDLAGVGFPLVGGRLDVVGRAPVPTLVYRHRLHLVSLTAAPAATGLGPMPAARTLDGYNLVRWRDDATVYWAVSDLAPAELDEFARLFRTMPPDP